jgi:hypothetical protein
MVRIIAAAATLAVVVVLGIAPAAHAQDAQAVAQSCRALNPGGSIGAKDIVPADPTTGLPSTWAAAPAGTFPGRVLLRSATRSYNRLYDFALREGNLYARLIAGGDPWRAVPLPLCLAGRLTAIAADDDELIALDRERRIYGMDNALKDATLWNWSSRWGPPLWQGPGFALPDDLIAWSWSVLSPVEDHSWTDPAGNHPAVGSDKVSHIWGLHEGGQRLTFWDPWLPLDESYEMCGPHRGRFKAVNLSASGSHVFVIGANGDMFTRLYDFDISGHDAVFFDYSYEDQRGKGDLAPIQLPAEPWRRQPKIPGRITSAISIAKRGVDAEHATLRVEGRRRGRTGYWQRDLAAPRSVPWTFHATGRPLEGRALHNPRRDTSRRDLGHVENARFVMRGAGITATIDRFATYCSPARLRVRSSGRTRTYVLHHVDGLRQQPRGRGLDTQPREQYGALERDGHFQLVTVLATRDAIELEERGWRFTRVPRART